MAKKKPNPLVTQAGDIVSQGLAPYLAEVRRQAQEAEQRALRRGEAIQRFSEATAQLQQPVGEDIENIYGRSAERQAIISKGLAIGAKAAQDEAAGKATALLDPRSPQKVTADPSMANVLYALGATPASVLNQSGAAFGAAARNLPEATRATGRQDVTASMFEAEAEQRKYADQILEIEAKRPGMVREVIAELEEMGLKREAQALNEAMAQAKFGLDVRQQEFQEGAKRVELSQAQQRIQDTRNRLAFDKAKSQFDQLLSKAGFELDLKKYDLAITTEARLAKAPKTGGFTPKQKQDLQQTAFDSAGDDFYGFTDPDTNERIPPRPPVETLRDLIAAGVPFSVAIKAIQRFGRGEKPDDMDSAMWNLWRATRGWTKKKPRSRRGR